MMYVDQFEVFRCTNHSMMAAQRSQTSRFNVGFSDRNSEPTGKQPKESYAWLLVQNSKKLSTKQSISSRSDRKREGTKMDRVTSRLASAIVDVVEFRRVWDCIKPII